MIEPLIIVLTPVKNEDWILDHFLSITSRFADHIIIADQQSTDNSVSIAKKYDKVLLINNPEQAYNEESRQNLLINTARENFGTGNILLALDADEIISADSIKSKNWDLMKAAPPGTVFRFDKPTIFFDRVRAFRYVEGWPLGYKDDGIKHRAGVIHSTRIPFSPTAKTILIKDISFVHFCFLRSNIQFSKNRFYCCIENIKNTQSLRVRRLKYQKYYLSDCVYEGELQPVLNEWFEGYPFNLDSFKEDNYYWIDFEVLRLFKKYGIKRFYNDPIWHFNWEECKKFAEASLNENFNSLKISPPSRLRIVTTDLFFSTVNKFTFKFRAIKNGLSNFRNEYKPAR